MDPIIRTRIKDFFEIAFANNIHLKLKKGYKLSDFNINPFILVAISSGVLGELSSINMAKALIYPRLLGTSINTNFGDRMQQLCTHILNAQASSTPGMDIEFIDQIDNIRLQIQLKAGPNTINAGDVNQIISEMNSAYRLLKQNKVKEMPLFAVGITYGSLNDISGHYKKISNSLVGGQTNVPILVGQDFWYRLTGDPMFYSNIISIFIELFEETNHVQLLNEAINKLAQEITDKYFTQSRFDQNKL